MLPDDDPRHGTTAGWHAHQKHGVPSCRPCRRAIAGYQAARIRDANYGRSRSVDATGTRRRIQALVANGYTFKDIGAELGVAHDVARQIAQHRKWVRRETAERVAEVYERLAMKPLTDNQSSRYARTVAARHGWVPPLAWDDIDNDPEPNLPADRLATHGRPVEEVLEEFDFLVKHGGESPEVAAQRLGYSLRTVIDNRNRLISTGRIQRGAA